MPKNVSAVMDDDYNYSMWVEIYNSGSSQVNQYNYYITDDANNKTKWRPSSKTILAKGYSVLYFERETISGHANFKLEPEGGTLYLFNTSGTEIDRVTYPKQYRNTSYGRITDGGDRWEYFENYSPGKANSGSEDSPSRCASPVFSTSGGFYPSSIQLSFRTTPLTEGDSIYYTTNGVEPTRSSTYYVPGSSITISKTTPIRAKSFSSPKLSSDVISATFFINVRNFKLPVSSIITDPVNLFDDMIGIYVDGKNGKPHDSVGNAPVNWNQDWSRPANYELYDTARVGRLNQELDIKITGNWSAKNAQKSLAINPKNKYGENQLKYPELFSQKPGQKYRSILLRNSGNDWGNTMMRDAMMMSLIEKRVNLEYQAYEPAVIFVNGEYYGIQNLRERSNKDLIYSAYGLKEEEIVLIEEWDLPGHSEYRKLHELAVSKNYNLSNAADYNQMKQMMDVDNFMDYMVVELYYANTDWPMKNIRAWKKVGSGNPWRWILYDTDLAFSNYDQNMLSFMLDFAESEPNYNVANKKIFKALVSNNDFKNELIDRFCYHISTTFDQGRVNYIIDSLAAKISTEIVYHKQKWGLGGNLQSGLSTLRTFAERRPDVMMRHLSQRFLGSIPFYTISVSSNTSKATYKYNSKYEVDRSSTNLKAFASRAINIEAQPVEGYDFDHWELKEVGRENAISYGDTWNYFDGSDVPDADWYKPAYDHTGWDSGKAPLGYVVGDGGFKSKIVTTIGYGGNAGNKYPTSYYRKKFTIESIANKTDFSATVYVDDGAAVYVNGSEIGRYNVPDGKLEFNTYASAYNEGYATFEIPAGLLVEGENVIAVEAHQCNASSSDVIFDLEMTYTVESDSEPAVNPVYSITPTKDVSLRAIYKPSVVIVDPDEGMKMFINEIVSENTKVEDEYGEFDDYIELYNDSPFDVNVGGWYISDKLSDKLLFQIHDTDEELTTIPPQSRLILWADGQVGQGVLHVGFNLKETGGSIILSKYNYLNELVIIDQVAFPGLDEDSSFSRVTDGSAEWAIQPPTFNQPNNSWISIDANQIRPTIYPVWVDNYFTVTNAGDRAVKVIDITGRTVIPEIFFSDGEGQMNASHLQPGIYLVIVGNESFKIIKR